MLPERVFRWVRRYRRPPLLAYVDSEGRPAVARVEATLRPEGIDVTSAITTHEGAPACLTYHRLVGNYRANDAFLIRGHFDAAGRLIPEKLVGYGGTADDRGVGSVKMLRLMGLWRDRLSARLARQSRPAVVARRSAPRRPAG